MFEKEVLEIAKDIYLHHFYGDVKYPDVLNAIIIGTQRGVDFGFQKGIKAKINTTTISDCPIKDEWHYVKDGIMPEENQWVLVYDGSYTVCNYHSNTPIKWLDNYENKVYEGSIVAWKEIVLPKEIKND